MTLRPRTGTTERISGELRRRAAPGDLAPWVFGFVHRDDTHGGEVVVVLPETRTSIQVMIADDYWLREQHASWRPVPRAAFWGPRYNWAYGYAKKHIKVFAVGLTPAGAAALIAKPMPDLIDQVVALDTAAFDAQPDESFEAWIERMAPHLRNAFAHAPKDTIDWQAPLHALATAGAGAIREAAALAGMSERQFRRLFREHYGVAPKQYQRVLRVDRLLRQLHPAPWETDTLIENPLEFADQPHIIREFKALTGMTPAAYVRRKRSDEDRVVRSVTAEGIAPPKDA